MAKEGYQLGDRAKSDFDGMRRRYHRQPDAGQARHRRVTWGDGANTDGNGNSSGPCGCCNCLDCVDLCDARDEDVVTDCEASGVALKTYSIDVGNWSAFPELGGTLVVTHVDGDCVWESDNLTQSSGVYKWVLTLAGASSTLQLEHVSGSDPVHLLNGFRQVKYEASGTWNSLCASPMKAVSVERITSPAGLNCSICVIPKLNSYDPICPTIPAVDGVIPCFPVVEFPDLGFLFSEDNPNHWRYVSGENIPGNPEFTFPYGFTGNTVRTIHLQRGLDAHCSWGGAIDEEGAEPEVISNGISIGGHGGVTFNAAVDYTAGTVELNFAAYHGSVIAQYYLDPDDWVIGVNTLALFTDYGSSSVVTWPATITITATDCYYSSSHPDYGYGCGYGASDSIGCTGYCFSVSVAGTSPTGFVWSNDGVETTCSSGCGCPTVAETTTIFGYPASLGEIAGNNPCVRP